MCNWSISHAKFFRRIYRLMIIGQEKNFSYWVNTHKCMKQSSYYWCYHQHSNTLIACTRNNIFTAEYYGHAFMQEFIIIIKERVSSCLYCHGEACVKWLHNKFIEQIGSICQKFNIIKPAFLDRPASNMPA